MTLHPLYHPLLKLNILFSEIWSGIYNTDKTMCCSSVCAHLYIKAPEKMNDERMLVLSVLCFTVLGMSAMILGSEDCCCMRNILQIRRYTSTVPIFSQN
jgi:hypothetical protein